MPGDRVAWVVPGAVEPPEWLEVGRRSTARRLAAQGRVSGSTGDGRKVAESMIPQGGDEDCHQVLESPYGLLGASAFLAELARSDAFRLYPCP